MNATDPANAACDVRFGQVGLACVRVRKADAAALCTELERRVITAPDLFKHTAVVVDLSHLPHLPDEGLVDAMLEAIRSAGMLPVGLTYADKDNNQLAERLGLPVIAKFREMMEQHKAIEGASIDVPQAASPEPLPAALDALPDKAPNYALAHYQSIRSGQQIYAPNQDLVITGNVANGAEIIADGSIHIYGTLRGKALAGANGNEHARIYCSHFEPELVSIAGCYRIFEKLPQDHFGQTVMVVFEKDNLNLLTI